MERFYQKYIVKDLASKMVFIGGPRQVGATMRKNFNQNVPFRSLDNQNESHTMTKAF